MKTKAKLTLAISVMSAAVLAAGVTSTFAWFTTQTAADATFSNLNIKAPSSLTITGRRVSGTAGALDADTAGNGVKDSEQNLGSVSSVDGNKFAAPTTIKAPGETYSFDDEDYAIIGANPATSHSGNSYIDFYKANLLVKAEDTTASMDLKVSVTVTTTPADASLLQWSRVAVYQAGAKADYASQTPSTAANRNPVGFAKVYGGDSGASKKCVNTNATPLAETTTAITAYATSDLVISNFSATDKAVCAEFVVSVWMEGYGYDNQNGARGKAINATVEFSLETHV